MKTKKSGYVKDQKITAKEKSSEKEKELLIDEQIDQFVTILVNTYLKLEHEKTIGIEE